MRLSDESRRKLEWQLRWQKLKYLGAGLAALAILGLGMMFESFDHDLVDREVAGVVDSVMVAPMKGNSSGVLAIGVNLDEGRYVRVLADPHRTLRIGERITVVEHRHGSGRLTHTLH